MNDIKRMLAEQTDLLKRLVELQEKAQNINQPMPMTHPTLNHWPHNVPTYGPLICHHEYPNPWNATTPPWCKKCGQQATDYGKVTC